MVMTIKLAYLIVSAAIVPLLILLVMCRVRFCKTKNDNYPPGPLDFPIVGYLPFLTKNPHLKLCQLSKIYGDIFSICLGSMRVIVLNSSEIIREAFNKPEFLGRPHQSIFSIADVHKPFFTNGPMWFEQRQFSLQILRKLQHTNSKAYEIIQEEINHFINMIKTDTPYDIEKLITPAISNSICAMLFGERYDYDDPHRVFLDRVIDEANRLIGQTSLFVCLPCLRFVPFLKRILKLNVVLNAFDSFKEFVKCKIAEHKAYLDANNLKDFIDYYLNEMQCEHNENKPSILSEKLLIGCIVALFGGASSTLRSTLSWCFYVMALHPNVQKQVQEEIDVVVGQERRPDISDQKDMPYTQSVLMEIQRLQTILPVGVLRMVLRDSHLAGYDIPRGTAVIANLWAIHHDSISFPSPDDFVADRFLNGISIRKSENFLPFSYGRRSCPGENFAVTAMFLFFTSVLQKFTLTYPESPTNPITLNGDLGLTYQPRMPNAIFTKRST